MLAQTQRHAVRYTDEAGNLRPELFDSEARAQATAMKGIAHSQIRRFFAQVMADKRRFDLSGEAAETEARVAMAMLKAKAAYTAGRDDKNQPLSDFVSHHAGLVNTITDFSHFARHFEAVVAWHKVEEKSNKKNKRS